MNNTNFSNYVLDNEQDPNETLDEIIKKVAAVKLDENFTLKQHFKLWWIRQDAHQWYMEMQYREDNIELMLKDFDEIKNRFEGQVEQEITYLISDDIDDERMKMVDASIKARSGYLKFLSLARKFNIINNS